MRRVVLATRNAHKVQEVQRILTACGGDVDLIPLPADAPEVAETGMTFAENALLKARSAAAATGLPALADDSGICVDALNGMPGVLSARWAGVHGDDSANLRLLIAQVGEVPSSRRGARFVCALAFVDADREVVVEGVQEGHLAQEPAGAAGFGYDPIFIGEGLTVTNAELDGAAKDAVSHRGRAVRAFVEQVLRG